MPFTQNNPDTEITTGLMVLPGVSLFPHSLLPLFIFEQRYRDMLRAALAGSRTMAIAHTDEQGLVSAIGSFGVIRACVTNPEGTSNLILQGLSRVVFSDIQMEPYPQARATVMPDQDAENPKNDDLRDSIQRAAEYFFDAGIVPAEGLRKLLVELEDHGSYADAIAAAFVRDSIERRGLIEESRVPVRMTRLVRVLLREIETLSDKAQ